MINGDNFRTSRFSYFEVQTRPSYIIGLDPKKEIFEESPTFLCCDSRDLDYLDPTDIGARDCDFRKGFSYSRPRIAIFSKSLCCLDSYDMDDTREYSYRGCS